MDFRVLGPLEVIGGAAPAPSGAKERTILSRLLLDAGRPVPADALLEAVWPGVEPARAARSLQVRLAHLRGFLEPEREPGAPSSLLVREGGAYRLAIDPGQVDAVRFERLVDRAGSLAAPAALAACDEALALWRGEPFAELSDDASARPEVRRLEELRTRAATSRTRALIELGRHDEALPELRRLVAEDPLQEEPARALALTLYRVGRQVEALDEIRELARRLRDLGLEPGAETRELEQAILAHDATLAASPATDSRPAGGPAAAPPLPRRASRFFGREAHLAHAAELIEERPLVTILGVGGAGKTRLALELAGRFAGKRPDGPWWCELAPVGIDADVAGAVGGAIGIESGGVDRLAEHLESRSGLLVLDNCEHVVEGSAGVVEALLARCPGLVVLTTSRAPLGVDGEHVLRLSGLDLPAGHAPDAAESPAVALFVDRARAAGGTVDLEADLDPIGELCRRLDGLPLALELAAGRTRSLSPSEIAGRLDERFGLLAVSGRRAAARHATLRAAIDWSYELLDEPCRRLFERLSVFARGCTLADAERVCAGDDVERRDVARLLDDLVASSLVTVDATDGRTVYGLLETLREYGRERLEASGETARVHDRHVDHYARRAFDLVGGGWRESKLPLVDELDEVRAAVRWCLTADATPDRAFVLLEALWWPALARHGEEVARLCDDALERWPDPHPARLRALGAASAVRLAVGDADRGRALAREAVALEQPGGERALLARRTLAQIAFFAEDPATALELWREQSAVARADGHEAFGCEADGFAIQLLDADGQTAEAVALAAGMRAEADRMASPFMRAWSRYVSGIALLETRPEEARRWLTEALDLARAADHHHMVRFSLRALGIAATLSDDRAEAAGRFVEALEYGEATADAASQWATLMALAVLLAHGGQLEPAAELLAVADDWPAAPYLARLVAAERARVADALDGEALAAAQARGRAAKLGEARARARAALAPEA